MEGGRRSCGWSKCAHGRRRMVESRGERRDSVGTYWIGLAQHRGQFVAAQTAGQIGERAQRRWEGTQVSRGSPALTMGFELHRAGSGSDGCPGGCRLIQRVYPLVQKLLVVEERD